MSGLWYEIRRAIPAPIPGMPWDGKGKVNMSPLLPATGERTEFRVTKTVELALHLTKCSGPESGSHPSPGQHRRAGAGGVRAEELAWLLDVCCTG